ncbi:hypothetical protein [Streptomyces sp. NPDC051561]
MIRSAAGAGEGTGGQVRQEGAGPVEDEARARGAVGRAHLP